MLSAPDVGAPPPAVDKSVKQLRGVVEQVQARGHWGLDARYREWEDLRAKLERQVGSAPPMPKKNLFGRMRPDVIERRVQGLNEFLQLCITNPSYAGLRDLADFLEREKNVAPEGLDMSTDSELRESEVGGAADASPVGERQQMLHQLIQSAQCL